MREYLIRTSTGHDWPAVDRTRFAEVLVPDGWAAEPVVGEGEYRVRTGDAVIAYAAEEVGWQVVVEGPLADAEAWVEQVTRQVAAAAGEPCEWLDLTEDAERPGPGAVDGAGGGPRTAVGRRGGRWWRRGSARSRGARGTGGRWG